MSEHITQAARPISMADIYGRIRRACREAGSQKAFAEKVGVSPQYLNSVLTATRPPGDALLAAVGIKRVVYFQEAAGT